MKIKEIVFLSFVILIISGCGGSGPDYPITNKDYQKGTSGLNFEFIPNTPPNNVFEESVFDVATDVWNKGAYEVTEGYMTLTVDETYMCVLDSENKCTTFPVLEKEKLAELNDLTSQRTAKLLEKTDVINDYYNGFDYERLDESYIKQLETEINELDAEIMKLKKTIKFTNDDLTKNLR